MRYDLIIEPMEWSYSRLSAFEDCPYLWLQRYIYNIPGQSKFFAQYGSLMHSILQKYLTGILHKQELVPYYLSHLVSDVTDKAPSHKIHMNYLEQGRQYLKTLSFPTRQIIKVEDKMQFQFAGHPFVGFLDVLSEDEDGQLYITDHKSRALKPRSNRVKPTLSDIELDKYQRQLYIYASAVYQLYGRYPDFLEFNCFRTGTWICEPFRYERLLEVEFWAMQLIEKITATNDWYANLDFWFCKNICDMAMECEYEEFL